MPEPLKINVKNTIYTTPILNEEMDNIAQQIYSVRQEIKSLNEHLSSNINNLNNLNNQFMAMYIQNTGSFPEN